MRSHVLLIAAALALVAGSALAQDAGGAAQSKPAPQPAAGGPIVVQRITDRFIVSPEYKVTDLDGRAGQLVGGTAGYLMQDVLLIGGSVYHLVGGAPGWELTYGGLVVGVQMPSDRRISFGARGLVGLGTATRVARLDSFIPIDHFPMPYSQFQGFGTDGHWMSNRFDRVPMLYPDMQVRMEDQFFLFEPQANVIVSVTDRIRFGVSGGYRVTGSDGPFRHSVNGATGAVTLQVGF